MIAEAVALIAIVTPMQHSEPPGRLEIDGVARAASCQTRACKKRVANKRKATVVAPYRSRFERIAQCESGGRWYISTGNGFFGGLQFTYSSWKAVGGWGYPHWNSKLEQMYRGVLLMRIQGWGAWPVCSQM